MVIFEYLIDYLFVFPILFSITLVVSFYFFTLLFGLGELTG